MAVIVPAVASSNLLRFLAAASPLIDGAAAFARYIQRPPGAAN